MLRNYNFFNQPVIFEKRWLHNHTEDFKYWRNVDCRRFIILGLRMFRITLPLTSITIASSVAILSYSPWCLLTVVMLSGFSNLGLRNCYIVEMTSFLFTFLALSSLCQSPSYCCVSSILHGTILHILDGTDIQEVIDAKSPRGSRSECVKNSENIQRDSSFTRVV